MAVATGFVCLSTYRTWNDDPWILPTPAKAVSLPVSEKPASLTAKPAINTDVIVSKNLFDPERGASATREAEENSRSSQRVRNLILLGTVIIGNDRTAVVQDAGGPAPAQGAAVQAAAPIRLKLGDDFEGYKLAEIADRRVVFTKDSARVEVLLDYFRKVEVSAPRPVPPGQPAPPAQAAPPPRVLPNLPRRGRAPVPGNPAPE